MAALLLEALLLGCGLFAAASIWSHGRMWLATIRKLSGEFRSCPLAQDVHVTITEISVVDEARILRPDFTARASRPAPRRALSAAA